MVFSQPSADDGYTVARRREGFHVVKRFPLRAPTGCRLLRSRPAGCAAGFLHRPMPIRITVHTPGSCHF
jgi:hypothetical protein